MIAQLLLTIGLVANLVGVVLLFRYGMPYRVRTGGNQIHWTVDNVDQKTVAAEKTYDALGFLGLVLIVGATVLQVIGTFMT